MAGLYLWNMLAAKHRLNLDDIVIIGWYIFFCLFMTGVFLN